MGCSFLRSPDPLPAGVSLCAWFDELARQLLTDCNLLITGQPHRIVEIEFYYHSPDHPDPFTHRDPMQQEFGRWYFHRAGGTYRNGSFKGLDLAIGNVDAHGGILLRGLETPDGKLVDGPSLLVNHLLTVTGTEGIAALDAAINGRLAWDASSPLRLEAVATDDPRRVFRSARVGLSLKRARGNTEMPRFILRPYRYLTEPRRTAKGKLLLVLALYTEGLDVDTIHQLTGCPRRSIVRYLQEFEVGRQEVNFEPYFGVELEPSALCRLYGICHGRGSR